MKRRRVAILVAIAACVVVALVVRLRRAPNAAQAGPPGRR